MSTQLVNTCTRPVELHLATGVVVIPPLSTFDCTADDLAVGQVQALCRSGVLAVRPGPATKSPSTTDTQTTTSKPDTTPTAAKTTTAPPRKPERAEKAEKAARKTEPAEPQDASDEEEK
jgi:hypothetical protein